MWPACLSDKTAFDHCRDKGMATTSLKLMLAWVFYLFIYFYYLLFRTEKLLSDPVLESL